MNSVPHILHWLFPSGAAVAEWVAAIATGCLVGAGFIQLKAIREGAEEQRERWKREDEIRAEENRPKAAFWLEQAANNDSSELWCANVGTVNFIVSGMEVNPLQGESRRIPFSRRNCLIVPAGIMQSTKLSDPEVMFGSERLGNAEITLIFQGPTDVKPYHLWFYDGRYMMKDPEGRFQGFEQITCSKCKAWAANFDVSGMISVVDCRREIAEVKKEFEATCPNHASSNSRVTFGT